MYLMRKKTLMSQIISFHQNGTYVKFALNATIGKEVTLKVTTSDKDGDDVTLSLQSGPAAGATFKADTGIFTWTPSTMEAVNIS